MVPIPEYPLYTAFINLFGAKFAPYYLDEDKKWGISLSSLVEVYRSYKSKGYNIKVFVLINPGNPTGNVYSEENITEIIKFCYEHKLVLIADEVYQNNIYSIKKKFHSARKLAMKLTNPYRNVSIFSVHSASKGYYGECGLRGGYIDFYNIPPLMKNAVLNMAAHYVNPGIIGQISVNTITNLT